MPLEEHDLKYLWDMLAAARECTGYVAGLSRDEYLRNMLVRRAVERTVEIVGEAARKVSDQGRRELPGVAWGAIVATRHILAHEYDDVDHEQIWRVVSVHVPRLVEQLTPVIESNPPGPESCKDPADP